MAGMGSDIKRQYYDLFIIHLAEENISGNRRIAIRYRLRKVQEKGCDIFRNRVIYVS